MVATAVLAALAAAPVVVGCSGSETAGDGMPDDCDVAQVRVEFGAEVPMDRVNSVFRAASDLDGAQVVQRDEELGDPPAIRVTATDGSARSVVERVEEIAGEDATSVTADCSTG